MSQFDKGKDGDVGTSAVGGEAKKHLPHEDLRGGEGPQINFRPTRYKAEDLAGLTWEIQIEPKEGVIRPCVLIDISTNGLCVLLEKPLTVEPEKSVHLKVLYDGNIAYEGLAKVVELRGNGEKTVCALALLDGLIDVTSILNVLTIKKDMEQANAQAKTLFAGWFVGNYEPLKAVVSEFKLFLEDAKASLDEFQKKNRWLVQAAESDKRLRKAFYEGLLAWPSRKFGEFATRAWETSREVTKQDFEQLKKFCWRHLHALVLEGPMFSRALAKPRGYAGDYLTMAYIYEHDFEGSTLFGKMEHYAACIHDVCVAVRNRKDFIVQRMLEKIKKTKKPSFKVLSVGSGPAYEFSDLFKLLHQDEIPQIEVVLFDVDPEALNFCFSRLREILLARGLSSKVRLRLLFDSVAHLLEDDYFLGDGYDFIFSAGLYDYISVKRSQLLTARLFSRLAPEGTLLIGNMTPKNTSRWAMEYLIDWFLIYREPMELPLFLEQIRGSFVFDVATEPTGVTGFVMATKT